ncbi:MAG TPA: hypothetical protein VLL77_03630 [Anaerolineales bacterium]|nr:hypothetical protein [Anaerolineales bacterium]
MRIQAEQQLTWFAEAVDQVEPFLLSDDVFRSLGGLSLLPRQDLSLGTLILAADVLGATEVPLSQADRARAAGLLRRWEAISSKVPAALDRKAMAEARQRANLWNAYARDLLDSRREAARYPAEVRHRVALERLLERLKEDAASTLRGAIRQADQAIRLLLEPDGFIWEGFLQAVYPPPAYWFLHGILKGEPA